ncbi:MAG TPA: S8 family serine peptidase, partial [Chroococcales cyanobacterium]
AVGTPARIKYFMAVSATDNRDQKAGFSCYGAELSVAAPGVDIMSTTPTYKVPLNDYGYAQNYASLQGTSMATPVVSGIAALVWARHPDWKAEQVRAQIEKSSRDIGNPGRDEYFGFGRVDALSAVQ